MSRSPLPTKTKVIGGVTFRAFAVYSNKKDADWMAERERAQGRHVRIFNIDGDYIVYRSQKGLKHVGKTHSKTYREMYSDKYSGKYAKLARKANW